MIIQEQIKKTQFINDQFTTTEAKKVISSLFESNKKIFKLLHLSNWESNHNIDLSDLDTKVNELKEKKTKLSSVLEQAAKEGYKVCIDSSIELKLVK